MSARQEKTHVVVFLFLVFSVLGSPQEARPNDFSEVLPVISFYVSFLEAAIKSL